MHVFIGFLLCATYFLSWVAAVWGMSYDSKSWIYKISCIWFYLPIALLILALIFALLITDHYNFSG